MAAGRSLRQRPEDAERDISRALTRPDVRSILGIERTGTLVMGIVNVTGDSFHAPSRAADLDAVLVLAERLIGEGADLLDIGGESTRPGATPVSADDERARVLPAIRALRARGHRLPISVDTYKAEVARAAVDSGATLVNDVSAGLLDEAMAPEVASLAVPIVLGHLRGTPATMSGHAEYADVIADLRAELAARVGEFVAAGVARERILIDPGIGFAKAARDSLALLRRLDELPTGALAGLPLVVGASRKRFVAQAMRDAGLAASDDAHDRLAGSLAAAVLAAACGAAIVRTHDVAETRRALAIADAILHEA
ncbi:dihydropteroate synthase [Candidatus Binatia bacterium]|nr:dihydropteroate synthase [Candidatus Binatia bacterium]